MHLETHSLNTLIFQYPPYLDDPEIAKLTCDFTQIIFDSINEPPELFNPHPLFKKIKAIEISKIRLNLQNMLTPFCKLIDNSLIKTPDSNERIFHMLYVGLKIAANVPFLVTALQRKKLSENFESYVLTSERIFPLELKIDAIFDYLYLTNFIKIESTQNENTLFQDFFSNEFVNDPEIDYILRFFLTVSDKKSMRAFLKIFLLSNESNKSEPITKYTKTALKLHFTKGLDFLHLLEELASEKESKHLFFSILNVLEMIQSNPKLNAIYQFLYQEFNFKHILCPFILYFENYLLSDPDTCITCLESILKLTHYNVKALEHYYTDGFNHHNDIILSFYSYLKFLNIFDAICWKKDLSISELSYRVDLLLQLAIHLSHDKIIDHGRTNSLKALCWFIPKANPQFDISNIQTLQIIVSILDKQPTQGQWKRALLYLDIYSPQEALQLYEYYILNRSQLSISKAAFMELSNNDQENYLFFHSHHRTRNTQIAKYVLKHQRHLEKHCLYTLIWLSEVPCNLSKNDHESLLNFLMPIYSYKIRIAALKTFSKSLSQQSPESFSKDIRNQIIDVLLTCCSSELFSSEKLEFIHILLETLSHYSFDERKDYNLIEALLDLSTTKSFSKNAKFAQIMTQFYLHIVAKGIYTKRTNFYESLPFTQLLLRSQEIIESDLWSAFDHDFKRDLSEEHFKRDIEVVHLQHPIKHSFEYQNRHRLLVAILDLFTELHLDVLKNHVNKEEKSHQIISNKYILNYTSRMPSTIYYIPFIVLPHHSNVFRGLGSKQGETLCQLSVLEAIMMGCYVRDLSLASHDTGNWSKRKQEYSGTFSTTSLEMALDDLYHNHENGALIVIKALKLNNDRLTLNLRVEKENHFNFLSFGGKPRNELDQIILHPSWKSDLMLIAGHEFSTQLLARIVNKYDNSPSGSSIKKNLKTILLSELRQLKLKLNLEGKKRVFQNLELQQLLDLHRQLNKNGFLNLRIIFSENPKDLLANTEANAEEIYQATVERLTLLSHMQNAYYDKFKIPYCFGQDDILILEPSLYPIKLNELLSMLFPFESTLVQRKFSNKKFLVLSIRKFEMKIQSLNLIPLEILKIFRLAFIFKNYTLESLTVALVNPHYQTFFGFKNEFQQSPHLVISLIKLYQNLCAEPNERIKKILISNWILASIGCYGENFSLTQFSELIKHFVESTTSEGTER